MILDTPTGPSAPWRIGLGALRKEQWVHLFIVALGLLAVVAAVRGARSATSLSFFPPEPRTLVPGSAAGYVVLASHGAQQSVPALAAFSAATGIKKETLAGGVDLLTRLGDTLIMTRWDTPLGVGRRSLALIGQVKLSDVVAMTQDAVVKRRVAELRRGLRIAVVSVTKGVKVYRLTFQDKGTAYAAIVAGDGVVASDMATLTEVIAANER